MLPNQKELVTSILMPLLVLISVVSCTSSQDGYEEFLAEREREYLERVATVFKEKGNVRLAATGRQHVEFIEALSKIEPPSHFKGRHDNLIDVHSLNAKVKLHLERLEPWEQEQWKRQGSDEVARCSRVLEVKFTPASSEYRFTCTVLWSADFILLHEMSEWEIGIFQMWTGDPYNLRD